MADESKREMILQNLKTTLEGINGAGQYWNEVKSVKRVTFVPTEFEGEDKPGLLIVATGEPETIENQHGYHDKRDLKVGIIGVMDRPDGDEGTAVNRFMKDVGIAVMADVTRGAYATQTFKISQLDASNLFGDLCLFEIELNIRYHCDGREE
ncbi:hypothetical protein ES705_36595 [subsurface metagenome]